MIQVRNLKKNFTSHIKEPALKGSIKSLFSRKTRTKEALKSVARSGVGPT